MFCSAVAVVDVVGVDDVMLLEQHTHTHAALIKSITFIQNNMSQKFAATVINIHYQLAMLLLLLLFSFHSVLLFVSLSKPFIVHKHEMGIAGYKL